MICMKIKASSENLIMNRKIHDSKAVSFSKIKVQPTSLIFYEIWQANFVLNLNV